MAPALFGIEIKDGLTIIGFIVAIGLGLWNLRATKRIRTGTIVIEELRSQVRDPLTKKLDELLIARNSFSTLVKPNGFKIDELREKVSDVISVLEFTILDISDLLKAANSSKFTKGNDWDISFESCIRDVQSEGNKLASPNITLKEIGASMVRINIKIESLNEKLRARLEEEVRRHLPK